MLTIGVVQKGVDLVCVDTREDRHQPRQPVELNAVENSGKIVAGALILAVVPLAVLPRPPPRLGPIAEMVIEGAEVADQLV